MFEKMIFENSKDYEYNGYILRDQIFTSDLSIELLESMKEKLKKK